MMVFDIYWLAESTIYEYPVVDADAELGHFQPVNT